MTTTYEFLVNSYKVAKRLPTKKRKKRLFSTSNLQVILMTALTLSFIPIVLVTTERGKSVFLKPAESEITYAECLTRQTDCHSQQKENNNYYFWSNFWIFIGTTAFSSIIYITIMRFIVSPLLESYLRSKTLELRKSLEEINLYLSQIGRLDLTTAESDILSEILSMISNYRPIDDENKAAIYLMQESIAEYIQLLMEPKVLSSTEE